MIIGGFGPWATALGFVSVSGTHGDGWIVSLGRDLLRSTAPDQTHHAAVTQDRVRELALQNLRSGSGLARQIHESLSLPLASSSRTKP